MRTLSGRVQRPAPAHSGFSLIESLVVTGVIGLLAAPLIPAAEGSREAARPARCGNNLRQIGLAVQAYHGVHGVYPPVWDLSRHDPDNRRILLQARGYSAFTQILPQPDQVPPANALNFSAGPSESYLRGYTPWGSEANFTVLRTGLGVALCPSDAGDSGLAGGVNYRANRGVTRWFTPDNGPWSCGFYSLSSSAVTDGLSQTVALSEKRRRRLSAARVDPRTDTVFGAVGLPCTAAESLAFRDALDGTPYGFSPRQGLAWAIGDLTQTCYNHAIGPNNTRPDCGFNAFDVPGGFVGARGSRPGGVRAAMADGSARFVMQTIAPAVWEALGTRAGSEAVSSDSY